MSNLFDALFEEMISSNDYYFVTASSVVQNFGSCLDASNPAFYLDSYKDCSISLVPFDDPDFGIVVGRIYSSKSKFSHEITDFTDDSIVYEIRNDDTYDVVYFAIP